MERIRKADGRRLRLYREEAWLTQEGLARRSGVTKNTIFRIEKGLNKSPQIGTLQAIADALEIPPEALLEDHPESVRPLGSLGRSPLTGSRKSMSGAANWDVGTRVEQPALDPG